MGLKGIQLNTCKECWIYFLECIKIDTAAYETQVFRTKMYDDNGLDILILSTNIRNEHVKWRNVHVWICQWNVCLCGGVRGSGGLAQKQLPSALITFWADATCQNLKGALWCQDFQWFSTFLRVRVPGGCFIQGRHLKRWHRNGCVSDNVNVNSGSSRVSFHSGRTVVGIPVRTPESICWPLQSQKCTSMKSIYRSPRLIQTPQQLSTFADHNPRKTANFAHLCGGSRSI